MIREKMRAAGCLLAVLAVLPLGGCSGGAQKEQKAYDAQYLDYFDTITTVTVYAENEEQWQQWKAMLEESMERYHQLFDIYNNYDGISNIKTINDSAGISPVQTDPEVVELLDFSLDMYEQTNGKVNVAMGSVLSIWHDYRESGTESPGGAKIPDKVELQQAAEHMDIHQMQLDGEKHTVYLPDARMKLDVGAVAKGFAAQKVCDELEAAGVTSALVSIGGNVQTIGHKADGNPWRVGIQDPDAQQAYLHAINLENSALVTSGTYQRYYEVDGVRYHHIINPDTLMPWNKYQSVTILCPDGRAADALSTAVFNMELEDGQALIESMEDTEAFWVLDDGTQVYSSGFEQYIND